MRSTCKLQTCSDGLRGVDDEVSVEMILNRMRVCVCALGRSSSNQHANIWKEMAKGCYDMGTHTHTRGAVILYTTVPVTSFHRVCVNDTVV